MALTRPRVMGIVNVTADSFSGDGLGDDVAAALARARQMVADGADIIDVGAESTRPGAEAIDPTTEIDRVVPVVEALQSLGVPISVDTRHAEVMRAALAGGADMINDVNALREPGALSAVAASNAAVCIMHMQGEPSTMQRSPAYGDVVAEVRSYLAARAAHAVSAGIAADRIVLDPGIGFGKTLDHNLALLAGLGSLRELGYPVLVGVSRKSMIGALTGRDVGDRLSGSLAAALFAVRSGAAILRVHDVRQTCDALKVWNALEGR